MQISDFLTATDAVVPYPAAGQGTTGELVYLTLGLAGDAGQAARRIQESLGNGGNLTPRLTLEVSASLGGVLWHWARLARALDLDPTDIMADVIDRLADGMQE